MQYIQLPKLVVKQLERYQCNFHWEITPIRKKLQLLKWSKVVTPKIQGGLEIQSLKLKNKPLFASQAWRLLQNPAALWAYTLLSKYLHSLAHIHSHISFIWQNLTTGWLFCQHGLKWTIGDGKRINFWTDSLLATNMPLHNLISGRIPI